MVQIAGKQIPKWLIVLLAVGVVVGVAGNVSSCLNRKLTKASTTATAEPTQQPGTPAAAPKPAPTFASGPVTEAAVKSALSGIDLAKVEVQDSLGTDASDDQIVHISYKPTGAAGLGEKPMLMDLTKVSADVFEKLFANSKVGAADAVLHARRRPGSHTLFADDGGALRHQGRCRRGCARYATRPSAHVRDELVARDQEHPACAESARTFGRVDDDDLLPRVRRRAGGCAA